MILRNSLFKKSASIKNVISLANNAIGSDTEGYRKEFIQLVQKATPLVKKAARKRKYMEDEEDEEETVSSGK